MAIRTGFAAAALLGAITTFGTTLWISTVLLLVAFVFGLASAELARLRKRSTNQVDL